MDFMVWRGIVNTLKKHNNLSGNKENIMDNDDAMNIYVSQKSVDTITQSELYLSFNLIDLESLKPNENRNFRS